MLRLCRNSAVFVHLAVSLMLLLPVQARASTYVFDAQQTHVRFSYKIGPLRQSASFTSVTGRVDLDEAIPERTRADVVTRTASLIAPEPWIGSELKGPDFFDVANYPEVRFIGQAFAKTGPDQGAMTGTLTMKGITRPVRVAVTHREQPGGTRTFSAVMRISRSAFNMSARSLLVADEVEIEMSGLLRKPQ